MTDLAASSAHAPLAIVGLSCLFPKAGNVQEFWTNIRNGVDAISEVPASHWRPDDYFDANPKTPDMTYARRGGFLSPVPFDPLEFGIAPSNLEAIDTSQLLGLVASRRALDDAGYGANGKNFDRSRVGCILGVTGTLEMVIPLGARLGHPKWRQALRDAGVADDVAQDVIERISESYVPWQENSFPGLLGNVVAGRIANRLDLGGTNCVVDAACASSLSALHLAAMELWSGRSDMVLTGGVDTFNDIFMYMCFSKTPALSATGDARPFADNADGTILGEGVGVLVLKRLADAERDGDRIYALLRGIGTSSDGAGNAVYAPKKEGQMRCVEDAYRVAGVTPDTIELVEAHGTGTKVGDATEVAGLVEVYRRSGRAGTWCALGSVKSQIGHTKAAAGAAGVFKAVLALQHRVLPPTIKVERPQDVLLAEDSPFYVNQQARPWLKAVNHPRRAAVSAFGFGGSNFHCVLEEAPRVTPQTDWDGDVVIAAFSGDSPASLRQQLAGWKSPLPWSTIRARAVQTRAAFRSSHEHRLVFVWEQGKTDVPAAIANAETLLETYADRRQWTTPDGVLYARGPREGKLAVLFPGQGSQYVGMLRELACRFPQMQDVLSDANTACAECVDGGALSSTVRLSDRIYPLPAWSPAAREAQELQLRATEVAQPAIGAVSLGALAILQQFGVTAELTAGHSYGELTALCASRRYHARALYRLSSLRGQLMAAAQEVDGGMLVVGAPLSQVEAAIAEAAVDLVIANRNSPNQVVLSGRLPDIERAAELFSRKKLRGKRLPVAAAFHSPLVASASAKFRPVLDEIEFHSGDVPVYSNTSAAEYPADPAEARDLLAGQLARPVEFVQQIENMYASGARCFIEVGPGSVLTGLVGSILSGRDFRALAIDASTGKRSGMFDLAMVLGQLATAGYVVNLTAWDPTAPAEVPPSERLLIPLSGANYIKPRTPRPPRVSTPAAPQPSASTVPPATAPVPAAAAATPSPTTAPPVSAASQLSAPMPAAVPAVAPRAVSPAPAPTGLTGSGNSLSNGRATAAPVTATPVAAEPVVSTHLALLQRMQEETARLHRQFLEGQEAALQTLAALARGTAPVAAPVHREPALIAAAPAPTPSAPPPRLAAAPAPAPAPLAPTSRTTAPAPAPRPVAAPSPAAAPRAQSAAPAAAPEKPVAAPVPAAPALPAANALTPQVLAVVAEKTGYPVEMLKPAMSLDHDLGIDSIKRVEILSALQEKLPQLPTVSPEQLQTLHRLQDVIDLLGPVSSAATSASLAPPAAVPAAAHAPAVLAPAKPAANDLTPQVMAVVAEKTGYPVEMLKPAMSLDHDLGIDSIKRVEILSALQEQLPQLPTVSPEQLQTLHRLQDVIDLLGPNTAGVVASAPAPVAAPSAIAPAPAKPIANDLTPQVMAVVAEKTGYPVEMLKPAMSLDHDLGIDSIKRVEILSALQEQLPQLPTVSPEQLQTLHRLQDVIDLLGPIAPAAATAPVAASLAVAAPATLAPTNPAASDLTPQVMAVVAEKTGYPVEMLKPAMSLDHDLGIDSIKRVEILSALQEQLPQLPTVSPEQLQTLHRLQDVIDLLGSSTPTAAAVTPELAAPAQVVVPPPAPVAIDLSSLTCGVLTAVEQPCDNSRVPLEFPAGAEFWITDDGTDLAMKLATRFSQAGLRVRVVRLDDLSTPVPAQTFAGLVVLAPDRGTSDADLWRALEWAQKLGPVLRETARTGRAALFATVSRMDGAFGLKHDGDMISGGLAGLTKTLRHEWPELTCKAIDIARPQNIDALAEQLYQELRHTGPVECGLTESGRVELLVEPVVSWDVPGSNQAPLQPGDVVIVTGGARGVTAAAAVALARNYRPTLVLLGRSPAPQPEPDYLRGVHEPAQIKQALATHGAASTPRALQQQCQQVLAHREIESTLRQLRDLGVRAEYRSADVRDIAAVGRLMEELQSRLGPIRGLVYGAGVLADQRLEDKTREQFDQVFGTKVAGLRNILGLLPQEQLRCLVLFSSFTARYGRKGQVDYAIANEVLNKQAQQWRRRHPDCRVVAFNWGPWDGGMVQGGLKTLFANEGVGLIPLASGAELVARVLAQPASLPAEIVVLGPDSTPLFGTAPAETAPAVPAEGVPSVIPADAWMSFERELSVTTAPYLLSHVLGGKAVMPLAMVADWLIHGAMHRTPGLDFQGWNSLRIFKGVRLDADETAALEVHVTKPRRDASEFVVTAYLVRRSETGLTLQASAEIVLGTGSAVEPAAQLQPASGDERTIAQPYSLLFHGPAFLGIEQVERCSTGGMVVRSRTAGVPETWLPRPLRSNWMADPLVIDVALQSLILWCRTYRGKPCLPAAVGRYRQYRRSYPASSVQVVIGITKATDHMVQADVEVRDSTGRVIASLQQVDNVMDQALQAAFNETSV